MPGFLGDELKGEAGLEVQWLERDSATDISSIWVSADGENMIVSTAACATALTPHDAQTVAAGLAPGDHLLMQGNLNSLTTAEAARTARAKGAIAVLNTAPIAWDLRSIFGMFDCVIANEVEAAMLAGGDAAHFWPALEAFDVATAILTVGARGARIFTRDADMIIPAPRNHRPDDGVVDTAGAGDVLVGTFVGLLAQGRNLQDAARIAVAAASLSVTRHGTLPSFPTREEIDYLQARLLE